MSRQMVINGVPNSIRLDGWWLIGGDSDPLGGVGGQGRLSPETFTVRHPVAISVLLCLVLLADWLFWGHRPGISVALFAMFLCASVVALRPGRTTRNEWVIALGFELACNLPVMESLQPLSLLFTAIGIVVLVVWVSYGQIVEWWQALWAMIRVSTVGAVQLPIGLGDELKDVQATADLKHHLKALILPLGIGLVFLLLLTSANPILERFLDQLAGLEFLNAEQFYRIAFWFVMASLIWPYLNLRNAWLGPVANAPKFRPISLPWLQTLVNMDSVRNSLVLFNILFLVQTVMDIGVLTGGMSLPEGMTYARYAHRGAYPLVVTALLAGIFALTTQKIIAEDRFLNRFLFLWLGQNLFLVVTAVFRLSLYVEAYTLTYLRISAFIWMALVFVGLVLIIIQITRSKSITWLVRSNMAILIGTLYFCSFVNFAQTIAAYNLNNADTAGRLDSRYICGLGEQALPVILGDDSVSGYTMCSRFGYKLPTHTPIVNWRDWSFREWRLQAYLDGQVQR